MRKKIKDYLAAVYCQPSELKIKKLLDQNYFQEKTPNDRKATKN